MVIDPSMAYQATIETTAGAMTVELFASEAPRTVNNFVFLAREGFYADVIFHRVISGFMIQGGDPTGTGTGGPGYRFEDEPVTRQYLRGTLAMANAGPNTNGSQFFVMHADYPLPPNYTIFGKLSAGEEVVDAIAGAPTGAQDRPVDPVAIKSVTITEA
jgi:cyclophilin family peptidyl-prolyl cis-trans isomerase